MIFQLNTILASTDHNEKANGNMEILYILVPSVAIPLAIALLFFFICVCRNNQMSARPPAPRQPKLVRGQNLEISVLNTAYKSKVCILYTEIQAAGLNLKIKYITL